MWVIAFVLVLSIVLDRLLLRPVTHVMGERDGAIRAARDLAVGLLGESAFQALHATGAIGASLLVAGFALTVFGTVAGIRRLATAGRRVG